ncbi:hypothetical protein [Nocardioides marmoraquaticus]
MSTAPIEPAVPGPLQPSHDPDREPEVPPNDPADPLPGADPAQPS